MIFLSRRIPSSLPLALFIASVLLVSGANIAKPVKETVSDDSTIGRMVVPTLPSEFTHLCIDETSPLGSARQWTREERIKAVGCLVVRPPSLLDSGDMTGG